MTFGCKHYFRSHQPSNRQRKYKHLRKSAKRYEALLTNIRVPLQDQGEGEAINLGQTSKGHLEPLEKAFPAGRHERVICTAVVVMVS